MMALAVERCYKGVAQRSGMLQTVEPGSCPWILLPHLLIKRRGVPASFIGLQGIVEHKPAGAERQQNQCGHNRNRNIGNLLFLHLLFPPYLSSACALPHSVQASAPGSCNVKLTHIRHHVAVALNGIYAETGRAVLQFLAALHHCRISYALARHDALHVYAVRHVYALVACSFNHHWLNVIDR